MTPEQKAKLTGKLVKWGLYAVAGIILMPLTVMAIKGWLLLFALAVLVGGTLTIAPALEMAACNWRLKLIKQQAAANPVETMQNLYQEKREALAEGEKKLISLRQKRATYMSKLASFKRRFPADSQYFETAADRLTELLKFQEQKFLAAKDATERYSGEVEKTQAIWEMGKAAAEATAGTEFTEEDFFAKIKSETAIDSAHQQLEVAFSQLDQALLDSEDKEPKGGPLPDKARAEFQKALET